MCPCALRMHARASRQHAIAPTLRSKYLAPIALNHLHADFGNVVRRYRAVRPVLR